MTMSVLLLLILLICAALLTVGIGFLLIYKPRWGLFFIAGLVCVFLAAIWFWHDARKNGLSGFADEVKKTINPQELQHWAVTTLDKTTSHSFDIQPQDMPASLRTLKSRNLSMEMAYYEVGQSSKESYLVFMWGGGFGHWGIDVGAPDFEQPDDGNTYLKWIPGVYFWKDND